MFLPCANEKCVYLVFVVREMRVYREAPVVEDENYVTEDLGVPGLSSGTLQAGREIEQNLSKDGVLV
ncbi:hypothetical protein PoB_001382300 [Plakobranchus ocellatus]|uniref:Uncharacterized protein n=1 Tax=Plakobranchus ocellatus TaxID=259542 RepID=A0AAV3YXS0_9GAST|nr:hypothetical protein PoB_001382300 [Plakobranchus ocellatus]